MVGKILQFNFFHQLIEEIEIVPSTYLKHLDDGIYEVGVRLGSNIYRVLAFYDEAKLVLTINGFQRKIRKTPSAELLRAKKFRKEYEQKKS